MRQDWKTREGREAYKRQMYSPQAGNFASIGEDYLMLFAVATFCDEHPVIGSITEAARQVLEAAREDRRWEHELEPDLWAMAPGDLLEFIDEVCDALPDVPATPKRKNAKLRLV